MTYDTSAAAAPKKSKAKGCAGIGCLGVVAIIAVAAIASAMSGGKSTPTASGSSSPAAGTATHAAAAPATTPAAAPAAAADTITYIVTGTSGADVQYGPAGSSSQGHVPMSITKPLGNPQYASISVQLQGSGAASCQIKVNGKVVSKATATGGFNLAQCEISKDPITGQWMDTNGG